MPTPQTAKTAAQRLDATVNALDSRIRGIRRFLHAHPEPSGEEFQTTAYLADLAQDAGLDFRIPRAGRGLIIDAGARDAPRRFALRADIDALRLHDEKSVDYRSRATNRMHACGHDAHTAMAAGAVLALAECADAMPADFAWRAVFQPEEETATGALAMIEDGAIEGIDAIIALHVDPVLSVGEIGYRHGALTATCEEFHITIEGRGGHGARPHTTDDPVPAAALAVQMIYTLVPRSVDAHAPTVVSIGMIEGGVNPNVIPNEVILRGTIRTIEPGGEDTVRTRIQEVLEGIERAAKVKCRLDTPYRIGGVRNDMAVTNRCLKAARDLVTGDNLVPVPRPSMGGEDFAHYLDHAPGCMLRLGVGFPGQPVRHLHSNTFDIHEDALAIGAKVLARSLLELHAGPLDEKHGG
ncbi:MAG: amidohydrolase [Opitutales bacterium]|nr:amidohydrolase [Opitutales bacterium]